MGAHYTIELEPNIAAYRLLIRPAPVYLFVDGVVRNAPVSAIFPPSNRDPCRRDLVDVGVRIRPKRTVDDCPCRSGSVRICAQPLGGQVARGSRRTRRGPGGNPTE